MQLLVQLCPRQLTVVMQALSDLPKSRVSRLEGHDEALHFRTILKGSRFFKLTQPADILGHHHLVGKLANHSYGSRGTLLEGDLREVRLRLELRYIINFQASGGARKTLSEIPILSHVASMQSDSITLD